MIRSEVLDLHAPSLPAILTPEEHEARRRLILAEYRGR